MEIPIDAITYTAACADLAGAMDRACDHQVVIIARDRGKPVVMLSLEDYNALVEARNLLSTPGNAKRLLRAIDQLSAGTPKPRRARDTDAQQMAPQHFALHSAAKLAGTHKKLSDLTASLPFFKPDFLVKARGLSLVARKALNACHFLSQQNPDAANHEIRLGYFKQQLIGFNSRNHKYLKEEIESGHTTLAQVGIIDRDVFTTEQLASVRLIDDVTFGGGLLKFSVDPALRAALATPEHAAALYMHINRAFGCRPALELYEHLSLYRDEGHSPWWSIEEFRASIVSQDNPSNSEFRYFRRDVIKPAIEGVNQWSDLALKIQTQRTGRRITHLRFLVAPNKRPPLAATIVPDTRS